MSLDLGSSHRRPGFAAVLRGAALAPLWGAQILTGMKSFADNPIIGSAMLNRRGLHAWRVALAHRMAARRRLRLSGLVDAADRATFDRDGVVVTRDFMTPGHFERVLAEVKAYRGQAREELQGDTITRRIPLSPSVLKSLPAIDELLESPKLRGLLRYAGGFDAEPMFYLQTILTRAHDGPCDPQRALHADAFHPTAKAWLFLADVASDAAPFTYVKGSHLPTPHRVDWEHRRAIDASGSPDIRTRRGSFRIDPAELAALGLGPPSALAVPANTLVVADTFGFHARGPSDHAVTRVEIWAYLRHTPFLPWPRLGLWNVKALARRRADFFWRWKDFAEAIGLGRNVWRARVNCSAFDPPAPPQSGISSAGG